MVEGLKATLKTLGTIGQGVSGESFIRLHDTENVSRDRCTNSSRDPDLNLQGYAPFIFYVYYLLLSVAYLA